MEKVCPPPDTVVGVLGSLHCGAFRLGDEELCVCELVVFPLFCSLFTHAWVLVVCLCVCLLPMSVVLWSKCVCLCVSLCVCVCV